MADIWGSSYAGTDPWPGAASWSDSALATNSSTGPAPVELHQLTQLPIDVENGFIASDTSPSNTTTNAVSGVQSFALVSPLLGTPLDDNLADNYTLATDNRPVESPIILNQRTQGIFPHGYGYYNDDATGSTPRTNVLIDQQLVLLYNQSRPRSGGNIGHLGAASNLVERMENMAPRVLDSETSGNLSNRPEDPWEERRQELHKLYVEDRLPLREVMSIMASNDFHANHWTYKSHFKKWGWRTYKKVKGYAKADDRTSTPGPSARQRNGRRRETNAPSTQRANSDSRGLRSGTAVVHQRRFISEVPTNNLKTVFTQSMTTIIVCVHNLYMDSISQGKWKVEDRFVVQESIHDDLIYCVASALRNYKSLEANIGEGGIKKSFRLLGRAIETCDPFSMPTIWESALRMIWRDCPQFARDFLKHAVRQAGRTQGLHPSFAQAIHLLLQFDKRLLADAIVSAYRSCIDLVMKTLPGHFTALSLLSDFIVYIDNSSQKEFQRALDGFQGLIYESEIRNGADHLRTLEIMGQKLYLLQSTPLTTMEAEKVAQDLLRRVNRQVRAGDRLEGKLLILWKDLKHTLGSFCHARGDLVAATMYMEESLIYGTNEEVDIFSLENLEAWYTELGEIDEASRVRELRITCSQTLLQTD